MKKTAIIIAICAALVIGGCGAAVAILRKPATAENNTKANPVSESQTTDYVDYTDSHIESDVDVTAEEIPGEETPAVSGTPASTVAGKINNVVTTARNAVTRAAANSKTTTAKNGGKNSATTTTTAKKSTTQSSNSNTKLDVKKLIGDDAQQSFLGYRYSSDGYYYCDDKDNWQKDTGYNEVYDKWAPYAAMYIDQVRIRFQYEGKNWMIQLWKGQYGYLLIGAEIGVYTCDLDKYSGGTGDVNHFNVADKSDWLKMQLDCYYCKGGNGTYKKVFTRPYDTYWWATGFVQGQVTKYTAPRTEIKTKNRITFKSADQANLFVQGLKLGGFRRAAGADQLVDDSYYMSGADVWVLWSTIYQDSFVGYEGRQ